MGPENEPLPCNLCALRNSQSPGGTRVDMLLADHRPKVTPSQRADVWLRLCREPLVHFMLGGGLVFLAYFAFSTPSPEVVVVTPEMVETIVQERSEQLGRPLSEAERSAAIEDLVDEELLVREAYRQGVDRQDAVIRQRLADKMRFLLAVEPASPTREQLEECFKARRSEITSSPQASFEDLVPNLRTLWVATERKAALRRCLDALRKQYRIQVPDGAIH